MIFSFLVASVSAGPTNTTGIGPSQRPTSSPIIDRCGVDGVVPHSYMVTFLNSNRNSTSRSASLDTEDKLRLLEGWVQQYINPEDTSNGTTRRKLEANSNSTYVLHLFTVIQLAVAVSASDDVRHTQHVPILSTSASHFYTSLTSHGPTCMHQTIARMAKDPAVASIEVDNPSP